MHVTVSSAVRRRTGSRCRSAPAGRGSLLPPAFFTAFFVFSFGTLLGMPALAEPLSLHELDRLALADEVGTEALEARARAEGERAIADAQLPDPTLSIGALNFPVDTFAFDQERMTQLRIGVRQQFPAAGTLSARRAAGEARAGAGWASADLRRREVLRSAREAWLALLWRQQIRTLLEEERPRLVALESAALAGYREGAGTQQDVLRARLEIDALDERLLRNAEAVDVARADLARWIGDGAARAVPVEPAAGALLSAAWPPGQDSAAVPASLRSHPLVAVRAARVEEARAHIDLAEANYGPDWGLEVGYGIRDELAPAGDTPDFLSAAVTVELPLFAGRRQDRRLAAAQADREAARAEQIDALLDLEREWRGVQARLEGLEARRALQAERIAPQSELTARAALNAYRSNAGDFPEVMRAVLAEIDVRLTLARLDHDLRRAAADLDYLIGVLPAAGSHGEEQ